MVRRALGLVVSAVVALIAASPAWAATITVTASAHGSAVLVQASGTADSCLTIGCQSQTVEVEVSAPAVTYVTTCITPISPQASTPIASTGGPFSFSTTVSESPGQQYLVCAYLMGSVYGSPDQIAASQPATVTLAPAACPAGTPAPLSLRAPATVAVGRQATIVVQGNNDGQPLASASLVAQQNGAVQPFYSRRFSAGELSSFNNGAPRRTFTLQLPHGSAPTTITLTYQEAQEALQPGSAQCIDQRTAMIRPILGEAPAVLLVNNPMDNLGGADVIFKAAGRCSQTRATPVAVTLHSGTVTSKISSADACRPGSWRVRGHSPGISTRRQVSAQGSTVKLEASGHINDVYRVSVRVGRRVLRRAWATVTYEHLPARRVYQGTDLFVNYCIDQTRPVYSLHLRLFCWEPAITVHYLKLSNNL